MVSGLCKYTVGQKRGLGFLWWALMDGSSPPTSSQGRVFRQLWFWDYWLQDHIACGVETRVVLRCPSEGAAGPGLVCGIEGRENRR